MPEAIAATQVFIDSISVDVTCPPLPVYRTAQDFQALRYCNRIAGNLVIDSTDPDVDFSALYDITIIEGAWIILSCGLTLFAQATWLSTTRP